MRVEKGLNGIELWECNLSNQMSKEKFHILYDYCQKSQEETEQKRNLLFLYEKRKKPSLTQWKTLIYFIEGEISIQKQFH